MVFHRWLHRSPQARLHSLPPILRIPDPPPVPSCSKAPRGLFVLSRVTRIFTGTSISPSPSLRQRPDRYAIRAGRNLPDKEFRYLRTVIVTAAVHWGFGSKRQPLPLTFQHWAGVSPYTSPYGLAETYVFGKQSPGPAPCDPRRFSAKSYTLRALLLPKLRSQLAEFLNEGSLDHLRVLTPAHQCRFAVRAPTALARRLFLPASDSMLGRFDRCPPPPLNLRRICLPPDAYAQGRTMSNGHARHLSSWVPPLLYNAAQWCWNTNQLSIAYGFRPRLRPD